MRSITNYILWKWLFFFGFVFWITLCVTDKYYMRNINQHILEAQFRATLEEVLKTTPIEVIKKLDVSQPKLEHKVNKKLESNCILNALTIIGFLIFVIVVKIRSWSGYGKEEGDLRNFELMIPFKSEKRNSNADSSTDENTLCDFNKEIYTNLEPVNFQNQEDDNLDELSDIIENTNKKPFGNAVIISRPESRSMRVPTVNVQSLQEKLEKLEQSVAAMRKRRTGIVSGTKEFQQFLNELTPIS